MSLVGPSSAVALCIDIPCHSPTPYYKVAVGFISGHTIVYRKVVYWTVVHQTTQSVYAATSIIYRSALDPSTEFPNVIIAK